MLQKLLRSAAVSSGNAISTVMLPGTGLRDLRGQQPVVGTGGRAAHLPDLPVVHSSLPISRTKARDRRP